MRVAVLVPIKDFRHAKQRLSGALSSEQRVRLARLMAARVIAAAHPHDVYVVCDDAQVAAFATEHGARVLWCPDLGLNGAVSAGFRQISTAADRILVAHSDLALATNFDAVLQHPKAAPGNEGIAIVPDRHGRGTNVIALPAATPFVFQFGGGSFAAHQAEARRLDQPVHVVADTRLAWDVDTPADLIHPDLQEFASWLPMNPANQPSPANHRSPR
jgi:2-phospho-L-lactate/phosphoenolpyruvate guanylyltransferase